MSVLRADSRAVGYMELPGAKKDADCKIVDVNGGVASEGGCCNLFKPQAGAKEFECGQCVYVLTKSSPADDRDAVAMDQAARAGNHYDLANAIMEAARKRQAKK